MDTIAEAKKVAGQDYLAKGKISVLLRKFAFPSILSGLVISLYNIIDQIFIGRSVGLLGNAATNVAYPVVLICTAVAIMSGVGCASGFNLEMGKGNPKKAGVIVGNAIVLMAALGCIIAAASLLFLEPLLRFFGSTDTVLPYARTYLGITAFAIPLSILGAGGSVIIRSDGSPTYALFSVASGAILHVALDYVFIFIYDWGIAGAAYATVIGQILSGILVIGYFLRFKTLKLTKEMFSPSLRCFGSIASLGMGPLVNNLSMFLVQILLNNQLTKYGAASMYGSDIPLACVGVITKLNSIFTAIVIGIAQGVQPIVSYNYGAKNYQRVKDAGKLDIQVMLSVSFIVFLCCQLIPRQIVSVFGTGSEIYYQFAEKYLRIFLMLICVNGMQVTAGNLFTSIGKARLSVFISITRQVLFLPPLIFILPLIFGIDGILYSGPIADAACVLIAVILLKRELKVIDQLEARSAGRALQVSDAGGDGTTRSECVME